MNRHPHHENPNPTKAEVHAHAAATRARKRAEAAAMGIAVEVGKDAIARFCRRRHIVRLAFFGSVLRDDFGPQSDVDVLVDFAPARTPDFFTLHEMEQELSGLLGGREVDILTFKSLNRRIRDEVLRSAEVEYAEA